MSIGFSDLLLAAHLRSADCAILDVGATTGVWLPRTDLVTFHYVLRGSVLINRGPGAGPQQIWLNPGDFAMLVGGDAHYLRVDPNAPTERFEHFCQTRSVEEPPLFRIGEGGAARVLSGVFGGARVADREDISPLPPVVVEHPQMGLDGPLFPFCGSGAEFEQACRGAGARAFICTIAHVMFIKLVRRSRRQAAVLNPDAQTMRMPKITLALRLIDASPERNWTISQLAKEVGTSRSMLAKQFLHLIGHPPIRYLTEVRMVRATEMLRDTDRSIADIAWSVGYQSASAFARTFRREQGIAPRQFRADALRTASNQAKDRHERGRSLLRTGPKNTTSLEHAR